MTQDEYNEAAALVVRLRKELEHTNQHLVAHIDALTKSNAQCAEYLRQNEQLTAELDRMKGDPLPIKLVGKLKDAEDSNKTLHSELVEVRAALAATTEQRDSLKRTLDEWNDADTKPHERVTADDLADHVVPPVLPFNSFPASENKEVCGIFGCDPKQHGPCPLQFTQLTHDEAMSRTLNKVLPLCMRSPKTETTPVLPLCNVCHECGSELANCSQGTNHHDCPRPLCPRTCTGRHGGGFSPYSGPCKSATPVRHE